jgi:DNA-binding LacI/PurR family transcriptional regulator
MISAPTRQAGIQAMRTLDVLIHGKKPRPQRTVLDVELILRDSCGNHASTRQQDTQG